MVQILVPSRHRSDGKPFGDLVADRNQYMRVVTKFTALLAKSFEEDAERYGREFAKRICTESEKKRRAEILGKWFRVLRGDLEWSIDRTLDNLGKALRTELNGGTYKPPAGQRLWVPEG